MSSILVGSAPDSWGVWFPDDPQQTPYTRFLDEVAASGYEWIELGPYGYLPTDPKQLSDELAARNLKLSAGTVFEHLHQDDSWDAVWKQIEDVAKLTAAVGGKHVVVIPEMWRDPATGAVLEDRNLTAEQWSKKTEGMNELGKAMFEKYGVRAQYHPHADSHVDTEENVYRFLDGTDGEFVNLCLDTGHISYCGGDNIAIIERAPERIGYLHLKQVDPEVRAKVEAEDLPFGEAVKLGAMTEPPLGIPDMPPLLAAIEKLGIDVFAIVEQDMYPCDVDHPLPIAQRTRKYLGSCGVPSVRFNCQEFETHVRPACCGPRRRHDGRRPCRSHHVEDRRRTGERRQRLRHREGRADRRDYPRLPRHRRSAGRHRRPGCRRGRARHPRADPREAAAGLPGARQAGDVREAA